MSEEKMMKITIYLEPEEVELEILTNYIDNFLSLTKGIHHDHFTEIIPIYGSRKSEEEIFLDLLRKIGLVAYYSRPEYNQYYAFLKLSDHDWGLPVSKEQFELIKKYFPEKEEYYKKLEEEEN